jgi:cytochrome P450
MHPANAIAAASHPDPYPYYRQLLAGAALQFDPGLGLWLACRAAVIQEVFDNAHCVVRPPAEPVPKAIADSSAGAVFGALARMSEGPAHALARQAIGRAVAQLDLAVVAARTRALAADTDADLPTWVMADLLGFSHRELPQVALWVGDFVRCLSPLSTEAQLAEASRAAQALMARVATLVQASGARPGTLLDHVCGQAEQTGWQAQHAILANLVGLLSQTHEATAGLIGNSVVALLSQPGLQQRLRAEPALAACLVREVARFDPPVQNTRRFVAQATTIAGVDLAPGAVILLLLGAAGRDEQAFSQANDFALDRPEHALPGFGHGRHACPGQALARTIAAAAIEHLLLRPAALDPAVLHWTYRPSVNGRLPLFNAPLKEAS